MRLFIAFWPFKEPFQQASGAIFKAPWLKLVVFFQDPSDFEWTFWTEWAKKSLLWTLAGHGVISRLTSIFYPKVGSRCYSTVEWNIATRWEEFWSKLCFWSLSQLRVPALTIYGFLAASSVLGIRGVSVLLVHLGLSFSVALLQKSALSWATNLLLLSTLHIRPLQEIQVDQITRVILVPVLVGGLLPCIKSTELKYVL